MSIANIKINQLNYNKPINIIYIIKIYISNRLFLDTFNWRSSLDLLLVSLNLSSCCLKCFLLTSKSKTLVWVASTEKGPVARGTVDWRRIWFNTVRWRSANLWKYNLCRKNRKSKGWTYIIVYCHNKIQDLKLNEISNRLK